MNPCLNPNIAGGGGLNQMAIFMIFGDLEVQAAPPALRSIQEPHAFRLKTIFKFDATLLD